MVNIMAIDDVVKLPLIDELINENMSKNMTNYKNEIINDADTSNEICEENKIINTEMARDSLQSLVVEKEMDSEKIELIATPDMKQEVDIASTALAAGACIPPPPASGGPLAPKAQEPDANTSNLDISPPIKFVNIGYYNCNSCPCIYHIECCEGEVGEGWSCPKCRESGATTGAVVTQGQKEDNSFLLNKWVLVFANQLRRWRLGCVIDRLGLWMNMCIFRSIHICIFTYIHMHIYTHMYKFINIHIHMYTYIYR
jgi:hypothetical protein